MSGISPHNKNSDPGLQNMHFADKINNLQSEKQQEFLKKALKAYCPKVYKVAKNQIVPSQRSNMSGLSSKTTSPERK